MNKIILISCVSTKLPSKAKARNLYISPLFKSNLKYAQSLNPDKIFILSAKYGLLNLDEEIEPYNQTLNTMSKQEKENWANQVLEQLKQKTNLQEDNFTFLAGENYRKNLLPHIQNHNTPMQGLGIGKQLQWLKNKNSPSTCHKLHNLFNSMEKHSFPFDENQIPKNGIYILFESGEKAHNTNRIVRIGTHTGENQLQNRLKQHFINENKDRSIFRKNIGRTILNKNQDPFLNQWELDLTTKESREQNQNINQEKQAEIEKQVSNYIQNNFTFTTIPIQDKEQRLKLESKIISTISNCQECKPSDTWFGLHSPKEKIKKSGLWLVNELWKQGLTDDDFVELKEIILNG